MRRNGATRRPTSRRVLVDGVGEHGRGELQDGEGEADVGAGLDAPDGIQEAYAEVERDAHDGDVDVAEGDGAGAAEVAVAGARPERPMVPAT